uniref:Uncharacterized protein n=1 Tax=Fagus sylvatica TaxID=28930 RepID=A0A2N9F2V3_FAGSY
MLSLSQLSPSQVTAVVMADWLGRGAAEQIWRPIWLRSASSCGGLHQLVAGFWVVGRRLWVVICVLSVSFPVGMLGCEDVCEISGEFDLLLGLDCRVGHGGEGVDLWWGEGTTARAKPKLKIEIKMEIQIDPAVKFPTQNLRSTSFWPAVAARVGVVSLTLSSSSISIPPPMFSYDDPVARLVTHSDLPYRMAVHPDGDGVVCSFPNRCRWYVIDEDKSQEVSETRLTLSDKVLTRLEDVGQQLALAFNYEGSALAAGGEDGKLRVFNWPGMEIILDEADAHKSVKDVDFSPDGKYLVSLGNSGPAKVWDMTSEKGPVSLPKENDEVFCSCRFSKGNDVNQVLYIAAVTGRGGSIVTWDTKTWKRIGSKTVVRDTISAFSVSPDGKLLACGTTQGEIFILHSTSQQVHSIVRKAHLGFVTALAFSHDSRALASVSLDSSARVTLIEEMNKTGGSNLWATMFVILLALVVYFLKNQGILR